MVILFFTCTGCPYPSLNDGPITQRLATKELRLQLLGNKLSIAVPVCCIKPVSPHLYIGHHNICTTMT